MFLTLPCHHLQTPQHYVPMAVGNYKFGKALRAIFARVPIVLLLLRWLVFWILDSALGQFYNDSQGQKARMERLAYSRTYIEDNAPGTSKRTNFSQSSLITFLQSNIGLYSLLSKILDVE